MTTETRNQREYLGRAGDNRTGLYVERGDWTESYYVTKAATVPVAVRRWWADTLTSWETFAFCDLGRFTNSTTCGIQHAAQAAGLGHVGRDDWALVLGGHTFDFEAVTDGQHPRDGAPGCVTRGLINVSTRERMAWPYGHVNGNRGWREYVASGHFGHVPTLEVAQ